MLVERMQHYVLAASPGNTFASLILTVPEGLATITFTAIAPGSPGNSITIELDQSGDDTPFAISVVGDAITVTLATSGTGDVTQGINDVAALLMDDPAVTALINVTTNSYAQFETIFPYVMTNLTGGSGGQNGANGYGLSIQLDADAPFRLYGVCLWNLGLSANFLDGFDGQISLRFTRPDGRYIQKQLTSSNLLFPGNQVNLGLTPNKAMVSPIYPNVLYPANSTIQIDIIGLPSNATMPVGSVIVFIGVKIFEDGAVWSPKYPAKWKARPYLENLTIPNLDITKGPSLNNTFTTQRDADFVFQAGVYTDVAGGGQQVDFDTEAGGLSIQAKPGAPAGITSQLVVGGAFSVVTIGEAITVTFTVSQATGTIVSGINADATAGALVTAVNMNNPLAPFQAFPITPIPAGLSADSICQLVDLGVIVRDWNQKAYSNGYVPAALLFPFLTAQMPGFLYPEIYIPVNQQIYFDLAYLYPGFTPGVNPITVVLGMKGMKVYHQ